MFIPVVNLSIYVIWLIHCLHRRVFDKKVLAVIIITVLAPVLGAICRIPLNFIPNDVLYNVLIHIVLYIQFVVPPIAMVWEQKARLSADSQT